MVAILKIGVKTNIAVIEFGLQLAPHCLLLPVAMVVVVLALEKKLLVVVLACLEEHL